MQPLGAEVLEPAPGVALLVLVGEAQPIDATDLIATVRIAGDGRRALVIDLRAFTSTDPAIVEALLDAERDGRVDRRSVHVVLPASAPLAGILRTTGLAEALHLHETRAAALAAVGA